MGHQKDAPATVDGASRMTQGDLFVDSETPKLQKAAKGFHCLQNIEI